MKITFLDGSNKEFENGLSSYEIAKSISSSLAKRSIFALVNNQPYDLMRPINFDATLELITEDDPRSIEILNHSCSHLMASAITKLYPGTNFGVGPAIEEGFYYDFKTPNGENLTESDFELIEKTMHEIANKNYDFERIEVTRKEALEMFKDDKYKVEIINELPENETITLYRHGDFVDLCRGPHLPNTKFLKHFKLLNISGHTGVVIAVTNNYNVYMEYASLKRRFRQLFGYIRRT